MPLIKIAKVINVAFVNIFSAASYFVDKQYN